MIVCCQHRSRWRTFWERLFAEYAIDPGNARACEIALIDAGCSELQLEQTAGAISNRLGECRLAFQRRFPKLSEQLELRGKPLKDRWNEVGLFLLSDIAHQIWREQPPEDWWPSRIDGLLVQPMRGGDGNYDTESRKFWVEAVLTDIDPTVPEVLRVAWLLTQIAIEIQMREKSSETVTGMPWALGRRSAGAVGGREGRNRDDHGLRSANFRCPGDLASGRRNDRKDHPEVVARVAENRVSDAGCPQSTRSHAQTSRRSTR